MFKLLLSLYIVCYSCIIFYSREPDYFDGETAHAIIKIDSLQSNATAIFAIKSIQYKVNANYPLRKLVDGQKVEVIYKIATPEKAVIYSIWGYWFKMGELLMSVILLFGFYYLTISITFNPSPEAIKELEDYVETPQRKYS